jgi:hypothetical protein
MSKRPVQASVVAAAAEVAATSYAELQSLPALMSVVKSPSAPPPGSNLQAVRALLQAIEVGLVNLQFLAQRAAIDASAGNVAALSDRIDWMNGIGKAWSDLAWRAQEVSPIAPARGSALVSIADSPNLRRLQQAERLLADALTPLVNEVVTGHHAGTLADFPSRTLLRYIMFERIGIDYSVVPLASSYVDFVQPEAIRSAVLERTVPGDTVFMQFRAAHQMPEILVDAANDHIEAALGCIGDHSYLEAAALLQRVDRLLDAVVLLADILVDHLDTDHYHEIREHLGVTSGSHSVGLHFHLMRDLLPALAAAVEKVVDDPKAGSSAGIAELRIYARSIAKHVDRWRLSHMNLPRTNLGGAGTGTRSLTGSSDALQTVARLRERAPGRTGNETLFKATDWTTLIVPLSTIEQRLLRNIASRTKERFPDVQSRSGRFADPPDFRPPPSRASKSQDHHADSGD